MQLGFDTQLSPFICLFANECTMIPYNSVSSGVNGLLTDTSTDFTEWANVTVLPGVWDLDLSVAIGKHNPVLLIRLCGKTAKVSAV